MSRVFISYRRSDTGYVARMLADRLNEEFGEDSVFMDIDNIPFGVDFRDHIAQAVGQAGVVLALIGDDWLDAKSAEGVRRLDDSGDFVRIELQSALERGIPVIPVLGGDAKMPNEQQLPPSLARLAYRNAAELRPGRNLPAQLQELIDALKKLLKSSQESEASEHKGPSPASQTAVDHVATPVTDKRSPIVPTSSPEIADAVVMDAEIVEPIMPAGSSPFAPNAILVPSRPKLTGGIQPFGTVPTWSAAPVVAENAVAARHITMREAAVWTIRYALLLFRPSYLVSWLFHILFYLSFTLCVTMFLIAKDPPPKDGTPSVDAAGATSGTATKESKAVGRAIEFVGLLIMLSVVYFLFWLPAIGLECFAWYRSQRPDSV